MSRKAELKERARGDLCVGARGRGSTHLHLEFLFLCLEPLALASGSPHGALDLPQFAERPLPQDLS